MQNYYVTWQPDIAEPGHYFLTHFQHERTDLSLGQIMDEVYRIEQIDEGTPREIASILRTDTRAAVLF